MPVYFAGLSPEVKLMSEKPLKPKPYKPIAGKIPPPPPKEKHPLQTITETAVQEFRKPLPSRYRNALTYMIVGGLVGGILYKVAAPIFGPIESAFSPAGFVLLVITLFLTISIIEGLRAAKRKQEQDDKIYKGLPDHLQELTDDELRKYNERLVSISEAQELLGEQNSDLFARAQKLSELKYKRQEIKRRFPNLTDDEINRLVEVEEIRELEKHR